MHKKLKSKTFNFIKPTIIFSIIGFFISGFTAIGIFGVQMLLTLLGMDCPIAWTVIWLFSILGSLTLPYVFYIHIQKIKQKKTRNLKAYLNIFNFLEYVLIQASLCMFFTSGDTLCNGKGGQNGLELIFSAWLAIPILICLSYIFTKTYSKKTEI